MGNSDHGTTNMSVGGDDGNTEEHAHGFGQHRATENPWPTRTCTKAFIESDCPPPHFQVSNLPYQYPVYGVLAKVDPKAWCKNQRLKKK